MVVDEIATGQKRHFSSHMYRYTSSCGYEMCIHTHVMTVYLIQGTARKLPRWTPGEQLWTQYWCGIPVCCKYLSVVVGPGGS